MDRRLAELLESAIPFALRLKRRFRDVDVREGVLVQGPAGWGEFAPFDDYSAAHAGRWLATAVEAAYVGLPSSVRDVVPVNAIIAATNAQDCAVQVREAVLDYGCSVVKIPVGSADLADDEARVAAARDVLDTTLGRGSGRIRIDAKGRWTRQGSIDALRRLGQYGLEYVEQPCSSRDDLRAVRHAVDIPIAVDESVRLEEGPDQVREFADIAIIKPAPLGGASAALDLADRIGMPVVVSGSLDSSIGLAVSLAVAAALPEVVHACGLGTGVLLASDLVDRPLVPVAGAMRVLRRVPEEGPLQQARELITPARADWWRRRVIEAWNACDETVRERVSA